MPPTGVIPSTEVPKRWNQTKGVEQSATAPNLSAWWQQLGDPVLNDLIDQALAANPSLEGARASLHEARVRRQIAGLDLQPSVSGSATRSSQKSTGDTSNSSTQNRYTAGLDASWEPDIWGEVAAAVRVAEATERAAEADLHAAHVSLAAEVALNYTELRSSQTRLAIARDNLARQEETLQLTSWRAQAGLTTELDVAQARTNVEQTRAGLPNLAAAVAEASHRLAVLVGRPPDALADDLATAARIPTLQDEIIVGIPADTLRQRPDVRAAEHRLMAATARVDEATAARYPSIKLSGSIGLEALGLWRTAFGRHRGAVVPRRPDRTDLQPRTDRAPDRGAECSRWAGVGLIREHDSHRPRGGRERTGSVLRRP